MCIKRICAACLRTFFKSERGNIAMMFALSLIPLMIGAGVGLDFARAMLVRQQMGEALDAAALAVGSTTGLDQTSALALAKKYFDANYTVDKTDYGTPSIALSNYNSKGSVTVTASNSMPTILVRLIGFNTLPVSTSSNVVWGQTRLWVALVLDNSGSMAQGDASGSKMTALKSAGNQLLTILQNASTTPGDVKVSIVPFIHNVNVGSANVGASWIDWMNWECPPQKVSDDYDCRDPIQATDAMLDGHPLNTFGPGDKCPFDSSRSFFCAPSSANDSTCTSYGAGDCVSTVPSNGYICPSMHIQNSQGGVNFHMYNGCWVATSGIGSTIIATGPDANCNDHPSHCGCGSYPYAYNGMAANTYFCVATTWNTTWVPNSHSTWKGCVMDRYPDYDIAVTTPTTATQHTLFPAENNAYCGTAITPLSYDWTNLSTQINAMVAYGATNQAIGIVHGWQTLTPGNPYGAPEVPDNTTRYMIVLSDGLNTLHRWYGDGSSEGTTLDGYIDAREKAACDAAKADDIIIYAIYVNIGNSSGNSAPLQYCASDATKYFSLTSTSAVVSTFQQIAQQISNLRVVK